MAIGIFDSGFGGLTVLRALIKKLPEESFIYLGDSARLPYGTKSKETIRKYLLQNIDFFKKREVKALVIACNSASSVLLEEDDFGIPVYNVIEPGARKALEISVNKQIGVIGTNATAQSSCYVTEIQKQESAAKVFQQACPLFVPLVEEGWEDDPLTNLIVHRYLQPLVGTGIDTMILGCTHYPVLVNSIRKVTRHHVQLVDSAESLALTVQSDLHSGKIPRNTEDETGLQILATDTSAVFESVAKRILDPVPYDGLSAVDIS